MTERTLTDEDIKLIAQAVARELRGPAIPRLLDAREVAIVLRMSPSGVRKLVERGDLIASGRGARGLLLFTHESVTAWIERRIHPSGGIEDSPSQYQPRTIEPRNSAETPFERARRVDQEALARRGRRKASPEMLDKVAKKLRRYHGSTK